MRILLAEDERSLSRALVALLERSNYSADAVYDGEEALAYLEGGNYDALILECPRWTALRCCGGCGSRAIPFQCCCLPPSRR